MIVVAADGVASPRIIVAEAGALHAVAVTANPEAAGFDLVALTVEVRGAFPSHVARVLLVDAESHDLHAGLGHSNDLGEVGDARLVAIGAAQDVTDLGAVDGGRSVGQSRGDDGVVHCEFHNGQPLKKVKSKNRRPAFAECRQF